MKSEILPSLWIGSLKVLEDSDFICQKNIKGYLNLEKDLSFLHQDLEYQGIVKENILKYRIIKLGEYLLEATRYIYQKLSRSEGVLIVSKNGFLKCDYVLVAYLIRYGKCNLEISKRILESKIQNKINLNILQSNALNFFIGKLEK
jgi:hypothetical protein